VIREFSKAVHVPERSAASLPGSFRLRGPVARDRRPSIDPFFNHECPSAGRWRWPSETGGAGRAEARDAAGVFVLASRDDEFQVIPRAKKWFASILSGER